jgi:F-type H+-transporting ATPase subunit delta
MSSKRDEKLVELDTEDKTVSVTTAVPMDDDLRAKVIKEVEAKFGAPVELVETVDPDILGGIVIEAHGERFDASVRAQLSSIRKQLSTAFLGGEEA